jgi:hypothetical protein
MKPSLETEMRTANQYLILSDFARKERKDFIKQSLTRRLRFWFHYWSTGRYTIKAAWLLAGGR